MPLCYSQCASFLIDGGSLLLHHAAHDKKRKHLTWRPGLLPSTSLLSYHSPRHRIVYTGLCLPFFSVRLPHCLRNRKDRPSLTSSQETLLQFQHFSPYIYQIC